MKNYFFQQFLSHVKNQPDAVALCDSKKQITYKQLFDHVSSVAGWFKYNDVKSTSRIGLYVDKNVDSIATIIGMFFAGCVYIPINRELPEARIKNICELAELDVMVTEPSSSMLEGSYRTADINELLYFNLEQNITCAIQNIYDPAYCLFTSGSTGEPKGVLISYSAADTFIQNAVENYYWEVNNNSNCIGFAPLHFDVFLTDIFAPLSAGALVYVLDKTFMPNYVLNILEKYKITNMVCVSPLLTLLVTASNYSDVDLSNLNFLLTGADVLKPADIEKLVLKCPDILIENGYGPTEFTVGCTTFPISIKNYNAYKAYPVGKLFPGLNAALMMNKGGINKDIVNETGELLLSGPQMMMGYLRKGGIDMSRILEVEGERYYQTGDLCYFDENRTLHFCGRKDDQVKLSGVRISLSEIEYYCLQHQSVSDAAAYLVGQQSVSVAIVLNKKPGQEIDKFCMIEHLARFLQKSLIPQNILFVDSIPRTSTGKTDRLKLAEQQVEEPSEVL